MSKRVETIRKYFRKGLYRREHLEALEKRGVITAQERRAIERGE